MERLLLMALFKATDFIFSRSYYGMLFLFISLTWNFRIGSFFFPPLQKANQSYLLSTAIIFCVDGWTGTIKPDLEHCPAQGESSPFIRDAPPLRHYCISKRRRHRLQKSHTPGVSPQASHSARPGRGSILQVDPSSVGLSSVSASLNSSDSPISLMLILCPFCWLHIPLFSSKYHSPFSFHIPPCPQALITLLKIMLRIACLFLTWLLSLRPACKLPAGHPHLDALLTWEWQQPSNWAHNHHRAVPLGLLNWKTKELNGIISKGMIIWQFHQVLNLLLSYNKLLFLFSAWLLPIEVDWNPRDLQAQLNTEPFKWNQILPPARGSSYLTPPQHFSICFLPLSSPGHSILQLTWRWSAHEF